MTSSLAAPLHFAAHLFGVLVALGAAAAIARDRGSRMARSAGVLGFVLLAAAGIAHGADFVGEVEGTTLALRGAGYLLLLWWVPLVWRGGLASRVALVTGAGLFVTGEALLQQRGSSVALSHGILVGAYAVVALVTRSAVRRSIRFRFLSGFVAVLLVVVFAISVTVTQVIDRNLRTGALQRVREQAVETAGGFDREIQGIARLVSILVEDKLSGRDSSVVEAAAGGAVEDRFPELDFVVFLNGAGVPTASTGDIGPDGPTVVAGAPVVTDCLSGDLPEYGSLENVEPQGIALLGCAPFRDAGKVAGVTVAGIFLDDALLDRVAAAGTRAAAFRGADPRPIAIVGAFPGISAGDDMFPASDLRAIHESILDPNASEEREVVIGRERYFSAFAALAAEDQRVIGVLMVSEPASTVAQTQTDVIRLIFLVTLAVVALALLLALLAAGRITRPVLALTQAARRVQAGDLSTKAEVTAQDEVGDLAAAFNSMTDSVTDMTDRLRSAAEEESRLRDRLETVLNSMGDGLVAVDRGGEVATYNPAAASILGLPESQVIGRPLASVFNGRDPEGRPLSLTEDLGGMAFVERPDGREVPVAITSAPLRDGSNAPLGRVYVLRDMTREHEVERMKTEFLSNVSHELRTPLTPIIGYSEIMTRRAVPEERGQEFAQAILDSARRLERIVAMLVDFSAMEGGRMTIEAEPVAMRKMVLAAAEEWKRKTSRHTIVTKLDPRLPNAMADVSLLRRAIDELLDNAVKYSPDGGKIRVSVSSENSTKRRILKVDVADEGIGIEEGDLPGIFEDFRQVDASDTRTFGGLGLGLAFVRRIIEAHGGEIGVESRPGQGTTFSFTLPATDTP